MILANNNITINNNTIINSSAKACKTNMGPGRGLIIQMGDQYCSSGSAAAGYGVGSDQNCQQIINFYMFLTHSFPYMVKGRDLVTGSGGYGYKIFNNTQKGAGGGIILIFTKSSLKLYNSHIQASGGNVQSNDSLSAGSGGTIFLYSDKLYGALCNVSVNGGASFNNKGAGSGGIVKVAYDERVLEDNQTLWINVSQGYQPNQPDEIIRANGIFSGPICNFGEARWYLGCQPCSKINQYSYNSMGNQICVSCPYSPNFKLGPTLNKNINPWQCFSSQFQDPYYLWIIPGQIDLLSIICYVILLIVFSLIGLIFRRQSKNRKRKLQENIFDFEQLKKQLKQEKILTDKLKSQKSIMPYELIYHVHRITLVGSNTYLCPWVLPIIPPQIVKKYVLISAFQNFAKKFNQIAKWTQFQIFLTKLLYLIYPLHWFYYDLVKKRKYKKLKTLLQQSREYNLLKDYQFEDKDLMKLKFSKNKDYTSCYIDFFFYQKADLSYYNLSVPFIISLSGQGNFIRPFYIEQKDPFVIAMEFIVNRNNYSTQKQQSLLTQKYFLVNNNTGDDKQKLLNNLVNLNLRKKNQSQLKSFIINFNSISCTLDLCSPIKDFIHKLSLLTQFINEWNKKFFNKFKVQIDLILMVSSLLEDNIISSSIHILSNKSQMKDFLEKVKAILPKMNLNNEIDMKIGLFIYNPEQKINNNQYEGQQLRDRDQLMIRKQYGESQQQDEQISQALIQQSNINNKKSITELISSNLTSFTYFFRYLILSHETTQFSRSSIKLFQSYLILTQTVLVFVWSIKIQLPYIFINLVSPFIGLIWMISDSYGFGKLFLIFNAMNLLNQIVTLIIYGIGVRDDTEYLVKIFICQGINLALVIGNMIVGSRAITFSKKLKNVQ